MKIAILQTNLTEPTGGERQSLTLALKLQQMGHDVTIFTQSLSDSCFLNLQKKVRIVVLSGGGIVHFEKAIVARRFNYPLLYNFRYFKNILQMRSFYRQLRLYLKDFDIINMHNFPMEWLSFWIRKDFPGKKISWMCNEPPFWYFNDEGWFSKFLNYFLFEFFDKRNIRNIDSILVLDELNKQRVLDIYGRKSTMVRSGVDIESTLFSVEEIAAHKKMLGLNQNDFIVLSVATFAKYKRPDKILLAVHKLCDRMPNIRVVLVGNGEMKDELDRMTGELHLDKHVLFLNHLSDEDLSKTYEMSELFVFPANQTWGLSAIEAMLHGKAVLITRDCGVSEIVHDRENAILINGSDPNDIAEKIADMFFDSEKRDYIGKNAKEFVTHNLSWDAYAQKMADEFHKLLKQIR